MIQKQVFLGAVSVAALALAPTFSQGQVITLHRNSVVRAVFDDRLTMSDSAVGDRFTCHVESDPDLPRGALFDGRILEIRRPRGGRPPSMDLEFTRIVLPNGTTVRMRAYPIALDSSALRTDGDGRIALRPDYAKQNADVVGGAIGGYIVGSLFHRRITGLVLGTVIGAIAADSDRARSENVVVDRGQRIGVLFDEDVDVPMAGAPRPRGAWGRSSGRGWDSAPETPAPATPAPSNGGWDARGDRDGTAPAPTVPTTAEGPPPIPTDRPARDISIRLDQRPVPYDGDPQPYYDGETVMVPVERTAGLLALDVEHGSNNSIYIESTDSSIKLAQDSTSYRLNGKRGNLSHPVVLKHGVLYAPVGIFSTLKHETLYVNGAKIDPRDYTPEDQ